jgi:outer membrane protein assembly factor BamE
MRLAALLLLALPLCGCELIFKLPTRQGNVIEQKEIDKVQVGMTREQVRFILGTPIAASAFRDDRWDYVGYYKNPRGKVYSRTVTLYFDGENKLARMEGEKAPAAANDGKPDMEAIEKEEKKAATEKERADEKTDTGIILKPKQ